MKQNLKLSYILTITGILLLLFTGVSNATIGGKLEGHWSKDFIKEQTVLDFFPKLAENNFEKLEPAKAIAISDAVSSLNLLYQKYNRETLSTSFSKPSDFPRKDILLLLVPVLKDENGKLPQIVQPFSYQDCKELTQQEIYLLQLLTEQGLLKGSSKSQFVPRQPMTQSEVIILLQRLETYLRDKLVPSPERRTLAFKIVEQSRSYNDKESYHVTETEDTIRLTIIKQFSTPGYTLSIQEMKLTESGIEVELKIDSPPRDAVLAQVITYQKVSAKINKSDIPSSIPIQFRVKGLKLEEM